MEIRRIVAAYFSPTGNTEKLAKAMAQAIAGPKLELLDFTVQSMVLEHRSAKELLRMREVLCDYFYGENLYVSTGESLNKYFEPFSMKAARQRHK